MTEKITDGKTVKIYKADTANVPVVYTNDYRENGVEVLKLCEEVGCPRFHLVTVSGLDWDAELSPWERGRLVSDEDNFKGRAAEHLDFMLNAVMPYADAELGGHGESFIAGYSLAGLFALWAMYNTAVFSAAACVSGSLWYPDFEEFAVKNSFKGSPNRLYISIGDRESRTKNQYLSKTEGICRTLAQFYTEKGINCAFELNKGNHFKNEPLRMAKGIAFILGDNNG